MSTTVIQEATERAAELRSARASRVVITGGATGTMLQASDATAGERIGALPEAGARLAREVADEFPAADGRPAGYSARWVRGPLDPGQSTDAIVVHHPAARYFSV